MVSCLGPSIHPARPGTEGWSVRASDGAQGARTPGAPTEQLLLCSWVIKTLIACSMVHFTWRRLYFHPVTLMQLCLYKRAVHLGAVAAHVAKKGTYSDTQAWCYLEPNKKKKSMQFVLRLADLSRCHGYTLRY